MHSLIQNVVVEAARRGRQHPQGPQHEPRLLAGDGLLELFHVLLDVCGGPDKNRTSLPFPVLLQAVMGSLVHRAEGGRSPLLSQRIKQYFGIPYTDL